jgi:hypothetical protein
VLVACLENQLVAFDAVTGTSAGSFSTKAEIRTPPILAGGLIVLGLRDRSVTAYALAGKLPVPPPEGKEPEPGAPPKPDAPSAPLPTPPTPPPPVEHPGDGR